MSEYPPDFLIDNAYSNCYKTHMSPQLIRRIRNVLGLTQQQLADLIEAQQVTVARWETGANEPKGAYLRALEELAEKARKKVGRRVKRQGG